MPFRRTYECTAAGASRCCAACWLFCALTIPMLAANWPAWRGPDGTGVATDTNLPLRWSTNENVRWRAPLPDHGNSTPAVWGQRIFIALDKKTGRTVSQFDLPPIPPTIKPEELGGPVATSSTPDSGKLSEIAGSWGTPLVVRAGGRDELVAALPLPLMAFAPRTGKQLWSSGGPNIGAYSSAFYGDGLVGLAARGFRNTLMVVRPGGRGDVTATHRLWFQFPGNSQTCIGSGVIFQGHIFLVHYIGIAECLDLKSGKTVWSERLPGTGARNSSWSSPVLAGERLYVPNQNADVFVLRAGPKFDLVAVNSIGGEPMNASLAVSDGDIFIRTDKNLWCISSPRR